MDSDVRPPVQGSSNESLQVKLGALASTQKPQPQTSQEPIETITEDEQGNFNQPSQPTGLNTPITQPKARGKGHRFHLSWPPSQKEWLVIALFVLLAGGLVAYVVSHVGPKPLASAKSIAKSAPPKVLPSTLTGLPVDPSVNQRPVTGVMIENSPDARPQSGLGQAGVVFEALAEGGVTRFLALFQDTAPSNIGPVRSARPYYIQWDMGFDAPYAHVGGSTDGLADIKAWGVKDLDEFANAGAYHRVSSRIAPHNVYTSIAALNQLEASKGYTTSNYKGFVRKKASPAAKPTARTINISLSGPIYNVHYDYNQATNTYNRSEGGAAPHIDANTNAQISPNVVITMVVPYALGALDTSGAYYSNYNPIGSGQAFIFQDGTVTTGQWNKPNNQSQITFTDASGKTIGLNPGQTWITAVQAASNVSSAP